jgi:hypothetical protein
LCLDRGTRLASQYQKAYELVKRIFTIAPITAESFLRVILINMMQGPENAHMRDNVVTTLTAATSEKPYACWDILKCWEYEQQLIDGHGHGTENNRAFVMMNRGRGKGPASGSSNPPTCTNCGRVGHVAASCWHQGGGMAGKRDEILAEKERRRGTPSGTPASSRAPTPASRPSSRTTNVRVDNTGRAYILDPDSQTV